MDTPTCILHGLVAAWLSSCVLILLRTLEPSQVSDILCKILCSDRWKQCREHPRNISRITNKKQTCGNCWLYTEWWKVTKYTNWTYSITALKNNIEAFYFRFYATFYFYSTLRSKYTFTLAFVSTVSTRQLITLHIHILNTKHNQQINYSIFFIQWETQQYICT